MTITTEDNDKRQLLRVLVKLMAVTLLAGILYVLFSGVFQSQTPEQPATITIDLSTIATGEAYYLEWKQRNVVVLHRTAEMLASSATLEQHLQHPQTVATQQPQWLVAIAHDMETGCPVNYVPPENTGPKDLPWHGGFQESCRSSWYDNMGRVYRTQRTTRNLSKPPHYFADNTQLIIGRNSE